MTERHRNSACRGHSRGMKSSFSSGMRRVSITYSKNYHVACPYKGASNMSLLTLRATGPRHHSASIKRREALFFGSSTAITWSSVAKAAEDRRPTQFKKSANGLAYLDVELGTGSDVKSGCKIAIAYTGRLAAKNGWIFAAERPEDGEPLIWRVGDSGENVIMGLDLVVQSMKVGGVRRVIVPPTLGYLDETTKPIPSEFWQRRRLYSTVFNGTRLANGEGDTLATTIWDIQVLRILECDNQGVDK